MKKLITILVVVLLLIFVLIYNSIQLSATNAYLEKKVEILEKQKETLEYRWKIYTQNVITISG